jgi:hypothetical protein
MQDGVADRLRTRRAIRRLTDRSISNASGPASRPIRGHPMIPTGQVAASRYRKIAGA